MQLTYNIIQKNKLFYSLFIIYIIVGTYILFTTEKVFFVLLLNQYYSPSLNLFFSYSTHLGDGFFFLACTILFILFNYYRALVLLSAYAFTSLIVQFLKRVIFYDVVRPKLYFESINIPLQFVDGIYINMSNSFPSGHTASAFTLAMLLSYFFKNKILSFCFFFSALIVGISRIYLAQHFFVDTFFGAIIGVIFGTMVLIFFEKKYIKSTLLQKGLLKKD